MGVAITLADIAKRGLLGGGSGSSGGGSGIPQEDIDAAFAALAEKGVTVPDGATSADLDDLIASIVTGGGGAATVFGRTVETGTFTSATAKSIMRIRHSLGTIPTGAIWWTEADAYADNSKDYPLMGCAIYYDDVNWYGLKAMISKGSASTTTSVSASGHYKTKSGNTSMFGEPNSGAAMGATVFNNANAESADFYAYPAFPAGVEFKYMLFGGLPK